ncbi:hypothetical protein BT63DRAFT_244835 [Microthyrium microscopicum]|uniref:C3H1-type domain-containing protein n=1 Tax=Microthyrium microscopicum TaxID=703497 RepID=A0A6A6UEG0_9PEZI|nr:hypothetical protein BT63DRAFT_244835 [Microthyrium microscopicum]
MEQSEPIIALEEVAQFRRFDDYRQVKLEQLVTQNDEQSRRIKQLMADLDEEREHKRTYREMSQAADQAIKRKKFVVVLIDGDGYKFKSSFLEAAHENGGEEAASALRRQVMNALQDNVVSLGADVDVMVNVFANRLGLSKVLFETGQIKSRDWFDQFFWSFGHQPLFHFIDCGYGKERADAKLRDTYRFYAHDIHCERIFLACCHDNGYVAELDKYRHDPVARNKTLLVKHKNTGAQYRDTPFGMVDFGEVFEPMPDKPIFRSPQFTQLLPIGSPSPVSAAAIPQAVNTVTTPKAVKNGKTTNGAAINHAVQAANNAANPLTTPRLPTPEESSVNGDRRPSNSNSNSYAGITSAANQERQPGNISVKPAPPKPKGIPVNRAKERIDIPLQPPNQIELEKFNKRRERSGANLCNNLHLTGFCGKYNCVYDHDPIDDGMRKTLRHKARALKCPFGTGCIKESCFLGHQCPWLEQCTNNKCQFTDAQHYGFDTKIFGTVAAEC